MGFLLLAVRSGVFMWVPYSDDTPVPLFEPFREFTNTILEALTIIDPKNGRLKIGGLKNTQADIKLGYVETQGLWEVSIIAGMNSLVTNSKVPN